MVLIHYASGTRVPLFQEFFLTSILLLAMVGFYYIFLRQKAFLGFTQTQPKKSGSSTEEHVSKNLACPRQFLGSPMTEIKCHFFPPPSAQVTCFSPTVSVKWSTRTSRSRCTFFQSFWNSLPNRFQLLNTQIIELYLHSSAHVSISRTFSLCPPIFGGIKYPSSLKPPPSPPVMRAT